MSQGIHVHFLLSHVAPETLRGSVAVVIDALRATTTIVHALAAGAERVVPCESVDEARAVAAGLPAGSVLLGGERGGVRIEGFDLGNSPLEYSPDRVAGKTVVFTTTNGTRALARCREADRILVAANVNVTAVMQELAADERTANVVCAGTDGRISMEDVAVAGGIVQRLEQSRGGEITLDDSAVIARDFWRQNVDQPGGMLEVFRKSHGGRNLIELGYDADVERSAQPNLFPVVPEFSVATREIRLVPTGKQKQLREFASQLHWLDWTSAARVASEAHAVASRRHYGLDPERVSDIERIDANRPGPDPEEWLRQRVGSSEIEIVFGDTEVCRTDGAFLLSHWRDALCRENAVILSRDRRWALFCCRDDQFEFGRMI